MRVNINLASQKYEEVRQFYVRWGWGIAATAVLTVLLLVFAGWNYSDSSQLNQGNKKLEQEVSALTLERASLEALARRPENHDVTEQKNFWNGQIAKRSFSWTQLFNDLQRIMPARAYVSSVHPELTLDHRLKLTLAIVSDKHDNGLELVRKMEKSERFRGPLIDIESTEKDTRTNTLLYKFAIVTYYTPAGLAPPRTGTKESM
jgi:Tfp pilus assembly protein PilN